MTISITDSAATYIADGSTQIFYVRNNGNNIYFEESSELTVTTRVSNTVETLVEGSDYTVSGAGSSEGYVTLLTPPADQIEVRIERNTPAVNSLNLTRGGVFSEESIENQFDKIARGLQDVGRQASSGSGLFDGHPLTLLPDGQAWDGEGKVLSNLLPGVANTDAVTVEQSREHLEAAEQAAASAAASAAVTAAIIQSGSIPYSEKAVENGVAPLDQNTLVPDSHIPSLAISKITGLADKLSAITPWVMAADNGCPGDGSDQTVALQAIVDALPVEGGVIVLHGDVLITALDLQGRRNIRFVGTATHGAGAGQSTMLKSNTFATRIIDCRDTVGIVFENLYLLQQNATFSGYFIDFGWISSGSALMSIKDCTAHSSGVSTGFMVNTYGATQGRFASSKFSGSGAAFKGQTTETGVLFSNQHLWECCSFNPSGGVTPIQGSGEGWTFKSCNFQADSADGKGRAINTSTSIEFRGLNIIGCSFYDVLAAGEIWIKANTGYGFNMHGNFLGGVDPASGGNYGVSLGGYLNGLKGISVVGNHARFMSALLSFAGSGATACSHGFVSGNSCFGGASPLTTLAGNIAAADDMLFAGNFVNASPDEYGSHLSYRGISAAAWNTDGIYKDSGALKIS